MAPGYDKGAPILQCQGVQRILGGNLILGGVTLTIRDITRPGHTTGQVVGLLGPSGIGKTVLFRTLSGLDKPDVGQVLIGDPPRPVERGMVGVVAQHYPLFAHRSVMGNLVLAGRLAGLSEAAAKEKARGFLLRFGLEDRARLYPIQLSGGQRQRVSIAQQFMSSEHFLLLDEPFSGLDPVQVDNVCELLAEVAAMHEHNTIVVVTHDISAAVEVSDTIFLLGRDRDEAGKIVPGAKIQAEIDLMERGLAWRHGITTTPEFAEIVREIRLRFVNL